MKTQLEILTSAEVTARHMLAAPNAFAAEQVKVADFEAADADEADYPQWNQYANSRLDEYRRLSGQESPSAAAARIAAQVAAQAKAAAPAVPVSGAAQNGPGVSVSK